MLVEFTKNLLNKITSKAFVVPCFFYTTENFILGCFKYQLCGPLMEKLKKADNFNSFNNLDVGGVPLRRRLPQVCFGLQTKSVQTQTDMITNVTIERCTNNLNGEIAVEFSEIVDIILNGYGCMEIDSNTLFVTFAMETKLKF